MSPFLHFGHLADKMALILFLGMDPDLVLCRILLTYAKPEKSDYAGQYIGSEKQIKDSCIKGGGKLHMSLADTILNGSPAHGTLRPGHCGRKK